MAVFTLCSQHVHAQEKQQSEDSDENDIEVIDIIKRDVTTESALDNRMEGDKEALDNSFAMTQHRQNYILPMTYITNPNSAGNSELTEENIDKKEAKFQVSTKFPLYLEEAGFDGVYFGFTLTSFWQLYNSEVSKPFRETNYEPEVFWQETADYSVFGYKFNTFQVGFNHMSNGQSGLQSRSWNRLFASIVFSDNDDIYYLKTWYRIPEDEKDDINDPTGDDNPDIQDYYGRIELGYGRKIGAFKMMALLRNNLDFDENRGSIQLDFTYPISDRYELLLQYFNGYGDSLIDYNRSQERIGVGFQLLFL
ncbi:MAG: phospholipase [Alteromonas sp.]|jgi:phospholipase A1|uniref:Phospholipase A1 n=2 Tax=Alteromonas TaxID=226 RepID=A0A353JJS4_9ALTE|nr:phospholipase [Alteromonas sp.]MAO30572.1 phospholipase [Alteromonas sp.]HAI71482.1 phospholipase [Alteromonas australica]HBF71759.1 phospholipase [Alteromonas australica]HBU50760.1 phospholipase [Alteromonas australica]|tara:strand:- start:4 stop:927 length:924 start_codon:yes stop_codon:yes gene_type:complete